MMNMKPNENGLFESVSVKQNELLGVFLGNGSAFNILLNWVGEYLYVSVMGKGCYCFATPPHFGYVNEKLGLKNENDARHMADFICDQLGCFRARQGTYREGRTFMEPAFIKN